MSCKTLHAMAFGGRLAGRPQAPADVSVARRTQAAVDGKPSPPPEPRERLRLAIFNARRADAGVTLPLRRMIHLVSLPKKITGNAAALGGPNALIAVPPGTD